MSNHKVCCENTIWAQHLWNLAENAPPIRSHSVSYPLLLYNEKTQEYYVGIYYEEWEGRGWSGVWGGEIPTPTHWHFMNFFDEGNINNYKEMNKEQS